MPIFWIGASFKDAPEALGKQEQAYNPYAVISPTGGRGLRFSLKPHFPIFVKDTAALGAGTGRRARVEWKRSIETLDLGVNAE